MYDELIAALRGPYDSRTDIQLMKQAADAIEELTSENESLAKSVSEASEILRRRWIPVTERLPEVRQVVLITDGIDVGTGWMNQGWWNTSFADIQRDDVTHWMPLPEPPKEE